MVHKRIKINKVDGRYRYMIDGFWYGYADTRENAMKEANYHIKKGHTRLI